MTRIKTGNRMPVMFWRSDALNNARHGHKHFMAVNDCDVAPCTARFAALESTRCTRGARVSLPLFPAGKQPFIAA
jgi:hypothetical protein